MKGVGHLNIKVNHKIIKDMCGTVSFKKGEAFYHSNKVKFEQYTSNESKAKVLGAEDFFVTIERDASGGIQTKCSCPKLASFDKDCQHIAAVLVAIYEHQRHGTAPIELDPANQDLTDGLFTLFNTQSVRLSGHQTYFENRQVLDVEFTCKPVTISKGQQMLGIEIKINEIHVQNIRTFLENLKEGSHCTLSDTFTFNHHLHCFPKETDAVIGQLIQMNHDEKMYFATLPNENSQPISNDLLLISPSSWKNLLPSLIKAPKVKLVYDGQTFDGLHLTDGLLPLQFDLEETNGNRYRLKINGLHQMVILNSYLTVLFNGKLKQLESQDCNRLYDLKQMVEASGTNDIPISHGQIGYFLEKVVPGLRKLGDVKISGVIANQFMKSPLIAKLYLDRVKNRLLAGLEFHYEKIVMNPLENRVLPAGSMVIRDVDKEDEILQLMDESLFTKTDGGYFLQNDELEYEFLTHVIPKMKKIVQIYATTAVRNRIFRGNVHPQIRVKFKRERTNWLEFTFEMDGIPEKHIRDVLQALEEKRKYYRLRDGLLLSLETSEFAEIHRFLHSPEIQNKDLASGLSLSINQSLQLLDTVDGSKVFKLEASFRQFLETIHNPGSLEFQLPSSLASILKDYQKLGFQWMKTLAYYGFGGILADDMGLGKTLQSLAFILSELPEIRKNKLPVLIVCPSSLTYNWLSEIMKFTPELRAIVIDGNKTERGKIQKKLTDIDVVITSYPLLRMDLTWYERQVFYTVFFDEAQVFKNPTTQTARAVKKIQADYRFALTGTPVENSIEELWSIFHIIFPELFLGLKEYSKLSRETIARRIRPFLLRRMKEDVLSEFPKKVESTESVELLPEQKKLYAAYLAKLRHDTLKHLDKDTLRKNRIKILAGITRLRQICCHPNLFVDNYKGKSAKFEQLMQIVEQSKLSGRRVLIFSQFTKMLELIGRQLALKGLPFFYLDGQTPSEDRIEICNRFNNGERDLFLISLKAGGTGLNLMSADTVILYDTWWNPAVEEQAADRAHRLGQKNDVQVIKLVARGTIEEKMNELQEKKRHLIEEIIDSDKKNLSALTEEDLREILMI